MGIVRGLGLLRRGDSAAFLAAARLFGAMERRVMPRRSRRRARATRASNGSRRGEGRVFQRTLILTSATRAAPSATRQRDSRDDGVSGRRTIRRARRRPAAGPQARRGPTGLGGDDEGDAREGRRGWALVGGHGRRRRSDDRSSAGAGRRGGPRASRGARPPQGAGHVRGVLLLVVRHSRR